MDAKLIIAECEAIIAKHVHPKRKSMGGRDAERLLMGLGNTRKEAAAKVTAWQNPATFAVGDTVSFTTPDGIVAAGTLVEDLGENGWSVSIRVSGLTALTIVPTKDIKA